MIRDRMTLWLLILLILLWCSHSPNEVPPEPQWNVSIAMVWGAMHPLKKPSLYSPIPDFKEISLSKTVDEILYLSV